jgi:hypothetical protein
MDDSVGSEAQAEHLLTKLVQGGYPVRTEKKTRDGKEVVVYSYETSVAQDNPARFFGPLKKKAKEDTKLQDTKWAESLFWQLADITPEAQEALGVNGGILTDFQPTDLRSAQDRQAGKSALYQFPYTAATSTKRAHKVQYGGEVVVSDRWRAEFGEEIKNADQHFRIVYLTAKPEVDDGKIAGRLPSRISFRGDARSVGRPDCGGTDETQLIRSKSGRSPQVCRGEAPGSRQRHSEVPAR